MSKNLQKRIYTSLILFSILILMLLNNIFLAYFLLIISILSILEFFKINLIILKNKKTLQLMYNLMFIIYIFTISGTLLFFSNFFYLKILIFFLILICSISDIAGFIIGKVFKGPKLTKISPKKTISGSVGSIIFSSIFAVVVFYIFSNNINYNFAVLGALTSIGCQIGDLFFSFLKRKSSLKDTGNFLPGHGGILDRVDGMLLAIPVGFLSLYLIF